MEAETEPNRLNIAIIMDGNGRWARQRGLPRIEGHRQGVQNVIKISESMRDLPISHLTLFAFSVENWLRPKSETRALMNLLKSFLVKYRRKLVDKGICLRVIGRIDELPKTVQKELEKTLQATANGDKLTVILALNYGAQTEIVDAVKNYTQAVQKGNEAPDELSWDILSNYLYTGPFPDPDLVIRTSGESRLSNFLLLQSAYAEIYFTPVLWPDFTPEDLTKAIETYKKRERRFGRTGDQVNSDKRSSKLLHP